MSFCIWRGCVAVLALASTCQNFLHRKWILARTCKHLLCWTGVTPTGSGQGHFHSSQILCHTVRYIMSFIFIYRTEENGGDDSQETSRWLPMNISLWIWYLLLSVLSLLRYYYISKRLNMCRYIICICTCISKFNFFRNVRFLLSEPKYFLVHVKHQFIFMKMMTLML